MFSQSEVTHLTPITCSSKELAAMLQQILQVAVNDLYRVYVDLFTLEAEGTVKRGDTLHSLAEMAALPGFNPGDDVLIEIRAWKSGEFNMFLGISLHSRRDELGVRVACYDTVCENAVLEKLTGLFPPKPPTVEIVAVPWPTRIALPETLPELSDAAPAQPKAVSGQPNVLPEQAAKAPAQPAASPAAPPHQEPASKPSSLRWAVILLLLFVAVVVLAMVFREPPKPAPQQTPPPAPAHAPVPEPKVEPKVDPKPAPVPAPAPAAEPKPVPAPAPAPEAKPKPAPAPAPKPEAKPEVKPEPKPEPTPPPAPREREIDGTWPATEPYVAPKP